jgi:hypothetical protein
LSSVAEFFNFTCLKPEDGASSLDLFGIGEVIEVLYFGDYMALSYSFVRNAIVLDVTNLLTIFGYGV